MAPSLSGLQTLASLVGLLSIRVGVMLAALPAPFGSLTPIPVRAALSVLLAVAISLAYAGQPVDVDTSTISILSAVTGEALVGAVIGLTARVILAATEIAGSLAGNAMGLGFATSVDPDFGQESLPTTRLVAILGILIFLIFRGHHAVIEAVAKTVTLAKPGHVFSVFIHGGLVRISNSMLARGLQVAAPVVGTMFIIHLSTALASKAAPRVQLFILTFAVSVAAGLLTLFLAAPAIVTAIAVEIRRLPPALAAILGAR